MVKSVAIVFTGLITTATLASPVDSLVSAYRPTFSMIKISRRRDGSSLTPALPWGNAGTNPSSTPNCSYFDFVFATGESPMSIKPAFMSVRFPYFLSGSKHQSQEYFDNVAVPGNYGRGQTFTFGIEMGNLTGVFIGLNACVYNSNLPGGLFGDNMGFEFKTGYNLKLTDEFALRPFASVDFNTLIIRFPQKINNVGNDVTILNNVFPYQYQYKTKYGYKTGYNNEIGVGVSEKTVLFKFGLEFSYNLTPGVVLEAGAGYCTSFAPRQSLLITGAKHVDHVIKNPVGFDFSSSVKPEEMFSYDGFYYQVGIAFRAVKKRHR